MSAPLQPHLDWYPIERAIAVRYDLALFGTDEYASMIAGRRNSQLDQALTARRLADMAGVNIRQVQRWRDQGWCTPYHLERIAEALSVHPSDLSGQYVTAIISMHEFAV